MAIRNVEDVEFYLSRIPHSEFMRLYMGEWNPKYLKFARECWDQYDAGADKTRNPACFLKNVVLGSYDQAVSLGFTGDANEWRREILRAQPCTRRHDEE